MCTQIVHPTCTKGVHAGVGPDIAARTSILTEFECIDVWLFPLFVNEDQFVLTAVEASLSGIGLHPNADILQLVVDRGASFEQFSHVSPVHADIGNCALSSMPRA